MEKEVSALSIEKAINDAKENDKKSKLDIIKSVGGILIWIIGIVFGAGALYAKVNGMEANSTEQDQAIVSIQANQIKIGQTLDRIEDNSKESSKKIFDELSQINDRISNIDERALRNEIKIENLEDDIKELKGK